MTNEFSRWLRGQMERREWGVSRMAREIGVNHGLVSQWLNGDRNPSPKSIDKIADSLVVNRDMLLTLAGHRDPDIEVEPGSPEAELIPLIRKIHWTEDRLIGAKGFLSGYLQADELERRRNKPS